MAAPPTVAQIDACLPQTQCARCDYPRCADYAKAIAEDGETINRCPPGGDTTLSLLSQLTGQAASALDPDVGEFMPRQLAVIDEAACIGCVLCIKACPVDAIIGANKTMHSVIEAECTGCELCIPVCPTDCISLAPISLKKDELPGQWPDYPQDFAKNARQRCESRLKRLENNVHKKAASAAGDRRSRQAELLAAIQRSQQKRP